MGEHSAQTSKLRSLAAYAWTHRRKIASALIVALPLVSRLVPDFPSDLILTYLRVFLGA
jgi:hypothetical protein